MTSCIVYFKMYANEMELVIEIKFSFFYISLIYIMTTCYNYSLREISKTNICMQYLFSLDIKIQYYRKKVKCL